MAEALAGLSGFHRIVDDIVIYDNTIEDHVSHVRQFLQRFTEKQIALNPQKRNFCVTKVTFAGFHLSSEGYQVEQSITDAISQFPKPTNRTDLRSFFGLVNQLSSSINTVATLLTPLRPLLSTKNDFLWSDNHEKAFTAAKDALTAVPILSFFDPNRPTRLCTDASRQGLGFVLQQQSNDITWNLIQAGSRFLTETGSRYAVIELEMLAVCWAIQKCKLFVTGLQHFSVITDHNPLVPIINNYRLDEIENPQLQRLKTRLMSYNFTAKWLKGSKNEAPDAVSRNPVSDPEPTDTLAELDVNDQADMSIAEIRALQGETHVNRHLQDLRQQAEQYEEYQQLRTVILQGFPTHRHQLTEPCRRYWNIREHLSLDDNLIVYGCRLLIPAEMRRQVLAQLHEAQ